MKGRIKIGFLQIGEVKNGSQHVASIKKRPAQICFRKIRFLQIAMYKLCFPKFELIERGKSQRALFKINAHNEIVAIIKMKPQKFAVYKPDIHEPDIAEFCHTKIATLEGAFFKIHI